MSLSNSALKTLCTLLNQSLQTQGVTVQVSHRDRQLYFLLEGETLPAESRYVPYLRHGFQTLQQSPAWQPGQSLAEFGELQGVTIYGRIQGQKQVGWTASFPLGAAPEAVQANGANGANGATRGGAAGSTSGSTSGSVQENPQQQTTARTAVKTPAPTTTQTAAQTAATPSQDPAASSPPRGASSAAPIAEAEAEMETLALTPESILAPDLFVAYPQGAADPRYPRSNPDPAPTPEFSPAPPPSAATPLATPGPTSQTAAWDLVEEDTAVQELLRLELPTLMSESDRVLDRPPQTAQAAAHQERSGAEGDAQALPSPSLSSALSDLEAQIAGAQIAGTPIAGAPIAGAPIAGVTEADPPLTETLDLDGLAPIAANHTPNSAKDGSEESQSEESQNEAARSVQTRLDSPPFASHPPESPSSPADLPLPDMSPLEPLQSVASNPDRPVDSTPTPSPLPPLDSASPSASTPAPLPTNSAPDPNPGFPWDDSEETDELPEQTHLLGRQGLVATVLMVLLVVLGVGTGGCYLLFLHQQSSTLAAVHTQ
ncbi:MAG: hypothetical protein ACO331_06460, partial [Prochlorothrix sp.]